MGHIGMRYSLPSRELIADAAETVINAHWFDGVFYIPNCDKITPGMILAAMRTNVPAVFCSGGPMKGGVDMTGHQATLSSLFEAVGTYQSGDMSKEELDYLEKNACPTCGSCSGMFTANSMNCLTEVLGLGLPGNGTIPAVYSERIILAKHAGMAVMNLLNNDIKQVLVEKVSNTEKLAKIIIKILKILGIIFVLGIVVGIFSYVIFNFNKTPMTVVEKQTVLLNCQLNGEKYDYLIEYDKDDNIIEAGGSDYITNIVKE